MTLIGEFVTHKSFGRGKIVEHENDFVLVLFEETGDRKKFIYPAAVGTFLMLSDENKAKECKALCDSLANDAAMARRDEADRLLAERNAAADLAKKLKKKAKKPAKKVVIEPEEDPYL
jgi:hypothetical protein